MTTRELALTVAESCGCVRGTVITVLLRDAGQGISWNRIKTCWSDEVARKLYTSAALGQQYRMPDYLRAHRAMQKSGVALSLLPAGRCDAGFTFCTCIHAARQASDDTAEKTGSSPAHIM